MSGAVKLACHCFISWLPREDTRQRQGEVITLGDSIRDINSDIELVITSPRFLKTFKTALCVGGREYKG